MRSLGALALVLVLSLVPVAQALASHEETKLYQISAWDMWDQDALNVLVIPPAHGPLFQPGGGAGEATPFNTYLEAVEDSIAAWHAGVQTFGSADLKKAFDPNVYVVGRDQVPASALSAPDILITTTDHTPLGLGVAIRPYPCIVNNSDVFSLTNYSDIFNINGQEYGHCLGANHVGTQGGVDPTSDLMHPEHDIMNGFYTHDIGEETTHLHCISNLDVLALNFVFTHKNPGWIPVFHRDAWEILLLDTQYRTTCGGDGMDPDPDYPYPKPEPASSVITSPRHGRAVTAQGLVIGGEVAGPGAGGVDVALVRRSGSRCSWWKPSANAFRRGDCAVPRWAAISSVSNWSYNLPVTLAPGEYEVRSRAADPDMGALEDGFEPGRNLISFTVR